MKLPLKVPARFDEAAAHIVNAQGLKGVLQFRPDMDSKAGGQLLEAWDYKCDIPTAQEIAAALRAIDLAAAKARRAAAYRNESDPIFFKVQRGEAKQSEWLASIADIKTRIPDPA